MKTIKCFFVCLLCLTLAEKVYACGVCSTMTLIYQIPFLIAFYFVSLVYGFTIYNILETKRLIKPTKIVILILKLLGIGLICLLITTGLPAGFFSVVGGVLYNSLVPTRYYNRMAVQGESDKKFLKKLKLILISCALILGVLAQIWAKVYFDNHLVEMSNFPNVGFTATEKLKAIKNPIEQSQYLNQLRENLDKERILIRQNSLEVLAEWKDRESIPIIIKAWQEERIFQAEEALEKITGEKFETPEDWETWRQEQNK